METSIVDHMKGAVYIEDGHSLAIHFGDHAVARLHIGDSRHPHKLRHDRPPLALFSSS
jgi:hypothetical protein